jgi:hypothetical protein
MNAASSNVKPADPIHAIQGFLVLDAFVRLFVWSGSMAIAFVLVARLDVWPVSADTMPTWRQLGDIAWALVLFVLVQNVAYVAFLVALRLPIPTPKEGRYTVAPGKPLDRQLVWSCLIATLTKARHEAPFPAFLVFHVSSLPPMRWFMSAIFGPKNKSCNVTDTVFADPYAIEVGRNVIFGYGAVIGAHVQGRDEIIIKKTVIEDDALVGGHVLTYGGCTVKRGGIVLGGAILRPNTVVGENEVWGGVPARKIKTLPPPGEAVEERSDVTAENREEDAPV